MAFDSRVFRVLIASPGDVDEERVVAAEVIQEWNARNAMELGAVLLPVRWETDSAPEYGKRPQEILNQQMVDGCDLTVGIFWTKLGTPTGVADSGTVEEIERTAAAGKLVMLYFSSARADVERIDTRQLDQLRAFKDRIKAIALYRVYATVQEFRNHFSRELDQQARKLISAGVAAPSEARPAGIGLDVQFADAESGLATGKNLKLELSPIQFTGELPDYVGDMPPDSDERKFAIAGAINRNYYRQWAARIQFKNLVAPLRFWLTNLGSVGARDVHVDLHFRTERDVLAIAKTTAFPRERPRRRVNKSGLLGDGFVPASIDDVVTLSNSWSTQLELPAIQPSRQLSPMPEISIGATESCEVTVTATMFAEMLPEPIVQTLTISIESTPREFAAEEWVAVLDAPERKEPNE